MSYRTKTYVTLAACLAAALPAAAAAQNLPYGNVSGDGGGGGDSGADGGGDTGDSGGRGGQGGQGRTYGIDIAPYIEVAQVATADLSPGNDVLTYSRIAAGVDASIRGRRNGASVSLRYERNIGWGKNAEDGDAVSGIARGYTTIVPGIQLEAGGLAARTRVENSGAAVLGPLGDGADVTNIYSVYAGPTVSTNVGAVKIDGGYRLGYTRVDSPDAVLTTAGQAPVDVFDDSITHNATLRAGVKAGDVLPVGVAVGGTYYREDISNLDQRVEDKSARADVSLPVGTDLELVAGIGYEDVTVAHRDAVRDGLGNPVVGSGGHYVTDKSVPRQIAFDTSGLIWDAGVIYRPSRRTAVEMHVGKRYGSMSYSGSFAYAPSSKSSINIGVYDTVGGFGGQVNRSLAAMPVQFQANRNVLSGDVTGCVGTTEGNGCLSGVLGSVRSSTFRARGIQASYNVDLGRISAGVGVGYDRRRFLAAAGTVLAVANGVIDENYWMAGYINAKLSERGTLSTNVFANMFHSGDSFAGDARAVGATASYGHLITNRLQATAAVGVDGVMRDDPTLPDIWTASALLGLRYTF